MKMHQQKKIIKIRQSIIERLKIKHSMVKLMIRHQNVKRP